MASHTIPTLDLATLAGAVEEDQAFVDALREIAHGPGFCYLVNHGIDAALEAQVVDVARQFFASSEAERMAISNTLTPHFRGYTRLGMEHTNGVSDWRDEIDIGPEHTPIEIGPGDPAWLRVRGPNQWPDCVPEMRPVITTWMAQMAELGRTMLRGLAVALGQPADHFEPYVTPLPETLCKVIRYPAQTSGVDTGQGVGLHHDSGLLTFILQDDVGGLQVMVDGQLIDAIPQPGSLIFNFGEMLQIATNGYIRATKHRVASPPAGRERISIAYFFNPCMEATFDVIDLPPALAAEAAGGASTRPDDTIFSNYGDNWLKFRLRSHPDVAAIHHPDLVGKYV